MKPAIELFQRYLDLVSAGEYAQAVNLFASDGAIEFPHFGSLGFPTRAEGHEGISKLLGTLTIFENFTFTDVKLYPGADPKIAFGEYEVN